MQPGPQGTSKPGQLTPETLPHSLGEEAQVPSPQQNGVEVSQHPSERLGQHCAEFRQQPPLSQEP